MALSLTRIQCIRRGHGEIAGPDPKLVAQVSSIDTALRDINTNSTATRSCDAPRAQPAIAARPPRRRERPDDDPPPTATHRESLAIAQQQAGPLLDRLHKLIEVDLANVEKQMNDAARHGRQGGFRRCHGSDIRKARARTRRV